MWYVVDMSNVAAKQPGGRERTRAMVSLKEPQAVGKSSESTPRLTNGVVGLSQG